MKLCSGAKGHAGETFVFSCLYLFAGHRRKAELREAIRIAVAEAAAATGLSLECKFEEVDLQIGGDDHNLLVASRRDAYLSRISVREFDFVPASPPCNTITRVQFANGIGPSPVRSLQYPFGFPWNDAAAQEKCDVGTTLMAFGVQALQACAQASRREPWRRTCGLLEHPEDLGEAQRGDPAAIWQFKETQELELSHGYRRGAVYQCELAEVDYAKPTGLISDVPDSWGFMALGWPMFEERGEARRSYRGPLSRKCACGRRHEGLVRRPQDQAFRTTNTAAWPWGMCMAIAKAAVADWLRRLCAHTGLHAAGMDDASAVRRPEHLAGVIEISPDAPPSSSIRGAPHS